MDTSLTKQYEVSFLLTDETGAREVLAALKERGAEILSESPVSRITLAYPILRHTQADFGFVQFSLDPIRVGELEAALKAIPSIIRFLIIIPPSGKNKPRSATSSYMVRPKVAPKTQEPRNIPETLTNEALERKIEEILK